MSEKSDEPYENEPDFQKVAWEHAIEQTAKMFKSLRNAGLSRNDAAAVIAQILTTGDMDGEDKRDS